MKTRKLIRCVTLVEVLVAVAIIAIFNDMVFLFACLV